MANRGQVSSNLAEALVMARRNGADLTAWGKGDNSQSLVKKIKARKAKAKKKRTRK